MGIREKERRALYRMVFTALMAAVVFVTTSFIKINIMTPVGPTMLKSGNIFCLLAGMLFGGVPGGLAAGIGSMLYDLMDPLFVADAPLTLTHPTMRWMSADTKSISPIAVSTTGTTSLLISTFVAIPSASRSAPAAMSIAAATTLDASLRPRDISLYFSSSVISYRPRLFRPFRLL